MVITRNQQAAIDALGNVLVLAGAGSGKTSTLVERCLLSVLRAGDPVNVDEMLIVTFTDAAAAEVRRRLNERLEIARTQAAPADALRLERQLALVPSAQISTLHSFCLHLVRQHFHALGLDPSLAVLSDEQAFLLMGAALDTVMESHFDAATKDAQRVQELIQVYGAGDEESLRRLLVRLHRYTQTLPDPSRWFAQQTATVQEEKPRQWREWLGTALIEWCDRWAAALEALPQNKFAGDFAARVRQARGGGAKQFAELFADIARSIDPLPRGLAAQRDAIQGFFAEAAFLQSLVDAPEGRDPLAEDWEWVRGHIATLLRLTREFSREYARRKREHASVDFQDLEQFALDLLLDKTRQSPTPIAAACRRAFRLIFVDEYQDINAAQDAILRAVARDGADANRFLVGDVKQSIYRFRLADPAIFQTYNARWREKSAEGKVIPLSDNFRSVSPILDFVNALFPAFMRPELGGVAYDEAAWLRAAKSDRPSPTPPCVEVHLRLTQRRDPGDEEPEENATDTELEARMVARRLRALHDAGHEVWDLRAQKMRPVRWSDMVVLLRSPRPRADTYLKEFASLGIPLQAERGGLYDSTEVTDLLSLLHILDNPLQDVPLLAVLRSPLVGLSLDELAEIRAAHRNGLFWTALNRWHDTMPIPLASETWACVDLFLKRFAKWRRMSRHAGLSERLEAILGETEYVEWLLTQSRPNQRQANVRRFTALAGQFDPMQRQGLQRFLRFVEAQREAQVDSEPDAFEDLDAVRLFSIHRSKGLEFPIVAVAGLGTRFNFQDLGQSILLDEQYGLCAQVKPPGCGTSYPSLAWWLARRRQRREMIGEELRLLYVALTRARDTLLLFGSASQKTAAQNWPEARRDLVSIEKASSPLAWLGPWCAQQAGANWCDTNQGTTPLFHWRLYADADLARSATLPEPKPKTKADLDPAKIDELIRRLQWQYPFSSSAHERAKVSVTALRDVGEEAELRFERPPAFPPRRQRSRLNAAEIGIAHHLFLQMVDLQHLLDAETLRHQAASLVRQQALSPEQGRSLDCEAIARFWNSEVGRQILAAAPAVHREIPFTARFTREDLAAAGMVASLPDGEFVVVQGSIDLAVIRDDDIWILDFKTDAITEADFPGAVDNYAPQLRLYGSALSRIYGRPVTARWIHFLKLSRTVEVSPSTPTSSA
jgi:ATP-dependent helicase/nuclease subunit A